MLLTKSCALVSLLTSQGTLAEGAPRGEGLVPTVDVGTCEWDLLGLQNVTKVRNKFVLDETGGHIAYVGVAAHVLVPDFGSQKEGNGMVSVDEAG